MGPCTCPEDVLRKIQNGGKSTGKGETRFRPGGRDYNDVVTISQCIAEIQYSSTKRQQWIADIQQVRDMKASMMMWQQLPNSTLHGKAIQWAKRALILRINNTKIQQYSTMKTIIWTVGWAWWSDSKYWWEHCALQKEVINVQKN